MLIKLYKETQILTKLPTYNCYIPRTHIVEYCYGQLEHMCLVNRKIDHVRSTYLFCVDIDTHKSWSLKLNYIKVYLYYIMDMAERELLHTSVPFLNPTKNWPPIKLWQIVDIYYHKSCNKSSKWSALGLVDLPKIHHIIEIVYHLNMQTHA